ncbi:MAG TPA: CDP-diacylglycerol--glycerol-3-phosphate 3-phosphatidyltransferase [Thermoguttaceae bacterium]|nr:CDP-diacylglycerol--glycerol-3-phosphate 3-phosphatidyltransferase [Thermoguttaceae bacterium]
MATNSPTTNRTLATVFNLPNQLSAVRLILAVVLFCFIANGFYLTGMVLFLIAASTDWLDGFFARRYGQVTTLGRILDPFADKVIICGTFIYLAAVPTMAKDPLGVKAWMVVVIVGRELLVTALRSYIEEKGGDFSAKMAGKLKMVLQCVAAAVGLYYLHSIAIVDEVATRQPADWCRWLLAGSVWSAVALTVYSGIVYIAAAVKLLRSQSEI